MYVVPVCLGRADPLTADFECIMLCMLSTRHQPYLPETVNLLWTPHTLILAC